MGLRDAVDAGMAEIRTTAEGIIASLKIEEKIKQAVFLGETLIDVPFRRGKNMHIIQEEVVRQIREEGFEVEYDYPCCTNARHDNYSDHFIACSECGTRWLREDYHASSGYGRIQISWDSKLNK